MAGNSVKPLQIALVGNPNTGKSTLFNALTGLRQRIGNYPGITVSMKTGTVFVKDTAAYITDLPGTYSLSASAPDERIMLDYITGKIPTTSTPDLLVCVIDATNLNRNLMLASQLAELKIPMVIALSFWDSLVKRKQNIDVELLSKRLGVPVVPVIASKGEGIDNLKDAIATASENNALMQRIAWEPGIQKAFNEFTEELETADSKPNEAQVQRLIFDSYKGDELEGVSEQKQKSAIENARSSLRTLGYHPHSIEAIQHSEHLKTVLKDVDHSPHVRAYRRGEKIDKFLTHRFWGLIVFTLFMYLVFQAVYSWSAPFMDAIDAGKSYIQDVAASSLEAFPQVQSLVVNGVIEGVGAFLIFLPQIVILFFFIALLEETGYMARAAFLMDKIFSWSGLNGKSFVPLLSSFACAIPGILATRTIEDKKSRLITILIAPLMSCSARLPVYVLMIGALIEPSYGPFVAGVTLFAIHLLGLVVALPVAFFLNRKLRNAPAQPFIIEMPDYQRPKVINLFWRMFQEGKEFVVRAGTIIFAMTIVIWALLYYPHPKELAGETTEAFIESKVAAGAIESEITAQLDDESSDLARELQFAIDQAYLENSILSRFGKWVQPVFDPAGFDWRISVGILASFPARELIVSTLGVVYSLGGEVDEESSQLRDVIRKSEWSEGKRAGQPVFTIPVVFAIMVFFALCQQCGSTLAIIRSESNTGWAVFSFVYMTALAWIGAVITYQGLSLFM